MERIRAWERPRSPLERWHFVEMALVAGRGGWGVGGAEGSGWTLSGVEAWAGLEPRKEGGALRGARPGPQSPAEGRGLAAGDRESVRPAGGSQGSSQQLGQPLWDGWLHPGLAAGW